MNSAIQDPFIAAFHREMKKARDRGWTSFYPFIDLHGTVLDSSYTGDDISRKIFDGAISCLQKISRRPDMKPVVWTSSREPDIEKYSEMFEGLGINFSYVNENPEQLDTSYASFAKKPYMSLIADDKAGFDPKRHWALLEEALDREPVLTCPKRHFEVAGTVMRIQSPIGPHDGHMALLHEMFACGDKVLIFLGCDKVFVSRKNPLGFDERAALLKEQIEAAGYGSRIYSILPLYGRRDNALWAHELDGTTKAHFQRPDFDSEKVGLFHSRDGFGPYYFLHGMFSLIEVPEIPNINATAIRESMGSSRVINIDYVKGMVAQEMKRPKHSVLLQTRVVVKNAEGMYGLVKYRSDDEVAYRFVGGYFSPEKDDSLGNSAVRKLESKLLFEGRSPLQFLDEVRISDWRYREAGTKIICMTYQATLQGDVSFNPKAPGARIKELVWVSRADLGKYVDEEEAAIIDRIK